MEKFSKYIEQVMEKVDLKGTKNKDYDKKNLKRGQKVEFEHTDNPERAKMIAKQHIAEFPKITKDGKITSDYYEELEKMENKLKSKQKKTLKSVLDDVVEENCMAGGANSVFGASVGSGDVFNGGFSGDNYAKGDARNLFGTVPKKRGKKSKKGKNKKFPIIRRNLRNI